MQNNSTQQFISFYKELVSIKLPEESIVFNYPPQEVLKNGQEKAVPLINISPPVVKVEEFFKTMEQVAEIMQKHQPELVQEITQIIDALPTEPSEKKLFVSHAIIPGNNLSHYLKQESSLDIFDFLRNYSVKPFMREYGKNMSPLYDLEKWLKGYCPVCGSNPNMAILEKEEGKRYLSCGWCETRWRFQRLGCPYCSNNESQYFTVEGISKYRVYFCDNCRGYIKTIVEKDAGDEEINLFWEDINSIQLDFLAMREGYFNQKSNLPLSEIEK